MAVVVLFVALSARQFRGSKSSKNFNDWQSHHEERA